MSPATSRDASQSSGQGTGWSTSITRIEPDHVMVRGYDVAELMGRISFGQAVYLILRGELPDERVGRLMDALLVSSIDHGATPPSALTARTVASTGASLSAAVAAGISCINRYHGGAVETCALQLGDLIERTRGSREPADRVIEIVLDEMRAEGTRLSGFGHRIHKNDPRTGRLFELAEAAGVSGPHMAMARAVEKAFGAAGKALPLNVDGAMAAILADLGFEPAVMNGLFMIARVPGLVAHVNEERTRERPMRRIDPVNHGYDGPEPRSLP